MYAYYKYPLIVIVILLIGGIAYLVWQKLPEEVTGKVGETITAPFSRRDDAGSPDADGARGGPAGAAAGTTPGGGVGDSMLTADASDLRARERLRTADKQLAAENLVAARELALKVIADPAIQEFDRNWYHAAQIVSRANSLFMNSEAPSPERIAYTVQAGNTLNGIAKKLGATVGGLQRINGLKSTDSTIYPGQVLYALRADWWMRVSKSQFVLLLLNGDVLFKLYPVGIGRQNRTPAGTFRVSSKVVHPDWTPPGRRIPYGDPENVLGTHWVGLTPVEETDPSLRGYGIHGTWEPDTVGKAASAGCIRMLNDDVAELFDFIPMPTSTAGTRVIIEE